MMTIYRVSELSGRTRKRQLPITPEQYYEFMCGMINTLPLNEEQMRFLMTGVVTQELNT